MPHLRKKMENNYNETRQDIKEKNALLTNSGIQHSFFLDFFSQTPLALNIRIFKINPFIDSTILNIPLNNIAYTIV